MAALCGLPGDPPVTARPAGRLPPRLIAALAFGAAALLLTGLWFGPILIGRHGDLVSWLLYVALPCFAAAVAGALLGLPLLTPGRQNGRAAALRGAGIAVVALLLFAPLYASVVKWTEPGWTSVMGLTLLVLEFGGLALGWLLVLMGGLVGWGLYRWAGRAGRGELFVNQRGQ